MERKIVADIEFMKLEKSKTSQEETDESYFMPSELTTCYYEYPLKILFPFSVTEGYCQWIYPMNYGGGLVEGDNINLTLKVGQQCCILMSTLSFQKVYCCENGRESQMNGVYSVGSKALLCIVPDPTVCYRKSSYSQSQTFHLSHDSNLVLLDWFTAGRYKRGERWEFTKLRSVTSIFLNGKLEFKEAQIMQDTPLIKVVTSMQSYNIVGTCIVIGPFLEFLSKFILAEIGRCKGYGEKPNPNLPLAVSPLLINESKIKCGCIVRFAATSVEDAMKKVESLLLPLFPTLGANPFQNK